MKISLPHDLVEQINKLPNPAISAIDDFGGSDKSILAYILLRILPSIIVAHMDDFIVKDKLTEPSWDNGAFDRGRLEKQVLNPIRQKKTVKYQKLIWNTNTLSVFVEMPHSDIVIVEGISAYHPSIVHYYDYKIWVQTPINVAKARGNARDNSNENAQHWNL